MGLDEAKQGIEMGRRLSHFMGSRWIDLNRMGSKIEEKKGWKIHVSIHPEDYDKMAPILAKIMEYRDNYGIGAKFAVKKFAEEMTNHPTQRGKTVTIYIPKEQAEVAPKIIEDVERIIEQEGIRTHQPAPNDEIVGKTGAVGVAYAHFGGEPIEVPDSFKHIYGEKIEDSARRKDPRLAVPLWKEKEFHELFGKIPLNVAVFKALKAMGRSDREAFEKMQTLCLRKEEHRTGEDKVNLKPGSVYTTAEDAKIHRISHPKKGSETALFPSLMIHGGWQSGLGAPAYVLSSKGYVKIDTGSAEIRRALEDVKHLHEDPHVVIERLPGTFRVYNIGKEGLDLERLR